MIALTFLVLYSKCLVQSSSTFDVVRFRQLQKDYQCKGVSSSSDLNSFVGKQVLDIQAYYLGSEVADHHFTIRLLMPTGERLNVATDKVPNWMLSSTSLRALVRVSRATKFEKIGYELVAAVPASALASKPIKSASSNIQVPTSALRDAEVFYIPKSDRDDYKKEFLSFHRANCRLIPNQRKLRLLLYGPEIQARQYEVERRERLASPGSMSILGDKYNLMEMELEQMKLKASEGGLSGTVKTLEKRGYKACEICNPLASSARKKKVKSR